MGGGHLPGRTRGNAPQSHPQRALAEDFAFSEQERVDETHRAVRFCTSWATKEESVDALCIRLRQLLGR